MTGNKFRSISITLSTLPVPFSAVRPHLGCFKGLKNALQGTSSLSAARSPAGSCVSDDPTQNPQYFWVGLAATSPN